MPVTKSEAEVVPLPPPQARGRMSLEEAIAARRTVREFLPDPPNAEQLSQLLWAMQGVTDRTGKRAAPSAGALYPLEIYVAMSGGLYHYEPERHGLTRRSRDDLRSALGRAALGQATVGQAPAVFVIAAVYNRTMTKYGPSRGPRYVQMEAGHVAENALLQAAALGLAGAPVGAFDDAKVKGVLGLPAGEEVLYLVPVGRARGE